MHAPHHEGAEEDPDGPEDRPDDAQGVVEAGGGRGPTAWRAWHADGRRGTSPTALSTVSRSSREPGLLPNSSAQEESGEVPYDPEHRADDLEDGVEVAEVRDPAGRRNGTAV